MDRKPIIMAISAVVLMMQGCATIRKTTDQLNSKVIRNAKAVEAEANKKIAVDYYNMALNEQKPAEAVKTFVGDRYIQHNPHVPNGTEAFVTYFTGFFKEYPQASFEIKRAVAEGDLVFLHVHFKKTPEDRGQAIVDIFRVEKEKVVEHWDVIQDVPEKAANDNTMF